MTYFIFEAMCACMYVHCSSTYYCVLLYVSIALEWVSEVPVYAMWYGRENQNLINSCPYRCRVRWMLRSVVSMMMLHSSSFVSSQLISAIEWEVDETDGRRVLTFDTCLHSLSSKVSFGFLYRTYSTNSRQSVLHIRHQTWLERALL
jgi:hypothetical protein